MDLTHYIGSRWYRAPEMMASSTKYGVAVDVWGARASRRSCYRRTPVSGDDEHAVLRRVSRVLGPFPEQVGQYLMGLGYLEDAWTRGRRRVSKPRGEAPW